MLICISFDIYEGRINKLLFFKEFALDKFSRNLLTKVSQSAFGLIDPSPWAPINLFVLSSTLYLTLILPMCHMFSIIWIWTKSSYFHSSFHGFSSTTSTPDLNLFSRIICWDLHALQSPYITDSHNIKWATTDFLGNTFIEKRALSCTVQVVFFTICDQIGNRWSCSYAPNLRRH